MSFPSSPTNGQVTTVNGIDYYYSTTSNAWYRKLKYSTTIQSINSSTTSTLQINNLTSATSTTTGALTVAGGTGIGGNLYVGGTISGSGIRTTTANSAPQNPSPGDVWYDTRDNTTLKYTYDGTSYYWVDISGGQRITATVTATFSASTLISSTVQILPATTATSTLTGSLVVTGGVGVRGSVYVNSTVSDRLGNMRSLGVNNRTTSYTLTAADNGALITITSGTITVPANVFSTGQTVTIYNSSTYTLLLSPSGTTLLYSGNNTGSTYINLTLYSVSSILCVASNTFVVSGAGIYPTP